MTKILIPIFLSLLIVGYLVQQAIGESSNKVVTVSELASETKPRNKVRLGARLTEGDISITTSPRREVKFLVRDVDSKNEKTNASNDDHENINIPVTYLGIMPDTLKPGRDVIMEGSFDPNNGFLATQLNTQCPSKYEPPDPTKNINKTL